MSTLPDSAASGPSPAALRATPSPEVARGGRGARASALLALLLAGGLAACDREAERPTGSFTLVATQRGPLPAVLGDRDNCVYSAVGGSVVLEPDSFRAEMLRERRCLAPESSDTLPDWTVDTLTDRGRGTFEVVGDSLFFRDRRGVGTGLGALRGDSLTVVGPQQTLHYTRDPAAQ